LPAKAAINRSSVLLGWWKLVIKPFTILKVNPGTIKILVLKSNVEILFNSK
jgi:hypothetical protein